MELINLPIPDMKTSFRVILERLSEWDESDEHQKRSADKSPPVSTEKREKADSLFTMRIQFLCPEDVKTDLDEELKKFGAKEDPSENKVKYDREKPIDNKARAKIASFLETYGITAHCHGHRYLEDAIALALEYPTILQSLSKELYPIVAEINSTSPICVERNIRTVIARAYSRGALEMFPTRPSNLMFLKYFATMVSQAEE